MKWNVVMAASGLALIANAQAGFLYLGDDSGKIEKKLNSLNGGSGTFAEALANDPVPAARAAEPEAGRGTLRLIPGKGRVSAALRDFAKANGWVLAWELERDFPIDYPATFSGTFLEVMEQVAKSLQNTDSPVRIKIYEANKVIRVIHATR
ncbi:toxin co-regulated pilus biosynthesis Q family protein [Chromobacterium vaccinii]|uniref:toxin co-regulated pilus biosynthesis Q family protein n=1 Tax=Chromobacterium vaccinii TaxID=1108595 RepID=UPI0006972CA0|nr:toxin co-regulated pilus biosynthesis Q family protein [Chromobacterium vaccinii]